MTTKIDLFLKLAQPDKNGFSRWVAITEFVGEYHSLVFGNGASWCRGSSSLSKRFNIEFDKTRTSGNSVDAIRLAGFKKLEAFNQTIRKDIRDFYRDKKCVMLGIRGNSENTQIELDHKDGRKMDPRVSNLATQKIEDFQPLCKAANDIKRHICKKCRETNKRWDATNILGNPYSFYEGNEDYSADLGCVGCYQYDPVEYRKRCIKKLTQEAVSFIMHKLSFEKK